MKVRISMFAVAFLVIVLTCSLAAAQVLKDDVAADQKTRVSLYAGANEMMTLGQVWQVTECCGWSGTWTRRAGTNIFDAKWRHTNGTTAQDVVTVQSWNKTTGAILLKRQSLNGQYSATVNPSARTITGGTATWYPAGEKWSAKY